jgi:radical SAM protein (TIGR01212 family)
MGRFVAFSDFLKERFGCRVHKVSFRIGNTCPNRDGTISWGGCIYCNGAELIPHSYRLGMGVREQVVSGMRAVVKRFGATRFIPYLQDNTGTYGDEERIIEALNEAISVEGVVGLSIGTRADCISERFFRYFEDVSRRLLLIVEIGVQSVNEETLRIINRGHDLKVVEMAFSRLNEMGVHTVAHIILGLPNDSDEDVVRMGRWLSQNDIKGVKIHNIVVLRGTPLFDMYNNKRFEPPSLEGLLRKYRLLFDNMRDGMVVHRLNTDVRPEFIVAPDYARDKNALLKRIKSVMD